MKSRSFNLLIVLALLLSLLGSAVTITPAHAAGIIVNTAVDEDINNVNCSLREAIIAANTNVAYNGCSAGAGADIITFAADYIITLTSGSQLPVVTTQITITGNGVTKTIIEANATVNTADYRVFEVSNTGNLTLDSLTIRNGVCAGACATETAKGGAILSSGTLTVTNSTLSSNYAYESGGGISTTSGTLTVTNSTFSGNHANGVGLGTGGGIANTGATLNIIDTTFSSNSAEAYGGGLANQSGTATITGSTFSGNSSAGGPSTSGGGFVNNATLMIDNSTFSGNFSSSSFNCATGGGGANSGTLTITNSTFSGNSVGFYGTGPGPCGSTDQADGGGLYNSGTLNLSNTTLANNTAAFTGGGIRSSGTLTVTNSTLSGNSANTGGGIYNIGTMTVANSTFSGNTSTWGGGIYHQGPSGVVTNSTFSNNSASTFSGGGINNETNLTVRNSTFSGNSATSGGGLYNHGTLIFANTIIANSTAGGDCVNGATISTNINNLVEDGTCNVGTTLQNFKTGDPNLSTSLADNGGPTQTLALQSPSIAIDAGDATTCSNAPVSNKDQRGVTRPIDGDAVVGAVCDIGAFEYGAIIPIVTASNPSASAVLTSLSSITVVFNQDMLDNATADGAENVNNYILVERGANASFDTVSCNGGVVSDDMQQTISTASYNSAGFVTTLTFSPLAAGTYRLFVCGTTSVWSAAGLELNNGASDYTVDFTIGAAAGTGRNGNRNASNTASSLPKTGFAPNKVTTLPAQPATLEYANLGDLWLEIPSLNVKSNIVGVPQVNGDWDVSWLGNDTGWLNGTAFPTWTGNSVLTAHVTNASGLEGPFAALKSLQYGDQIIVHMGGVKYVYEVRVTKLARPYTTNFTFESKQDASYLTLVTCSGYNPLNETYLFRRVVRAVLVSTVSE